MDESDSILKSAIKIRKGCVLSLVWPQTSYLCMHVYVQSFVSAVATNS